MLATFSLLFLYMATTQAQQSCLQNNVVYVPGADIIGISVAGCQSACRASPTCKYFTWNSLSQACGLRNSPVGALVDAPTQSTGTATSNDITQNAVYVNVLQRSQTLEQCQGACLDEGQCLAFTWYNANAGVLANTCTLSFEKPEVTLILPGRQIITSGKKSCLPNGNQGVDWTSGNNFAFACDFVGNDLANVRSTGEECGGRCAATFRCTHFVWTGFNGGTCFLKSGRVSKSDAIATRDRSNVCGIISDGSSAIINWTGNFALGCDFVGNDLSNVRTIAEECGPRCVNTPGCSHFTWTRFNGGTCFLKRGFVTKSDAVSTRELTTVCGLL